MMFGRDNNSFGPGCFGNAAPLPAIKISRIKYIFRFIAFSPFFVGKGIGPEMYEQVKLHLMPGQLLSGGSWHENIILCMTIQCNCQQEKKGGSFHFLILRT